MNEYQFKTTIPLFDVNHLTHHRVISELRYKKIDNWLNYGYFPPTIRDQACGNIAEKNTRTMTYIIISETVCEYCGQVYIDKSLTKSI